MEPWPPAQPPQHWERQAARGAWGEAPHALPLQPRQQLIRTGHPPRPGSWDGSQLPSHQPWEEGHRHRRDIHKQASRTSYHESSYPSRQGYEDPHWQYPAASYSNDYTYQWQPVAWQDNRDPRQGEHYGKSASYQDRHYYRGYHPNLASKPPGQDRTQTSDSHKKRHISSGQSEWAGGETLSQDSGEASGQPQESSGQPSLLLQYHESGLSSSSYELSQYIRDGSDHYDPMLPGTWSPAQAGGPLVSTPTAVVPHKFSWPHMAVCFGAGGQLVLVCPHQPVEGQPAYVELHSLEAILHDTKELQELQAFPGPLAREDLHKVDVMTFCQQKIAMSCDPSTQKGRDSALLWKLLLLLCRQNGSMVGSDTAELLMQDCRREEKYKRQNPAANLIGLTDDELMSRQPGTLDLITGEVPPVVETQKQIVEKFTKLLYYGRKKDALLWAMRNHLWGHALFLSSKMDPRTYSWVLTGFTSTLATNDPLQTLFQLMSGRIPQAALCCGDATWGDWRPHLAVMLSNKVGDVELNNRAIVTMGDTLAGKGAVEAAHFCYLMADIPFGYFGSKADRMALLGSSHLQTFAQFARTEAIQRMEIFEYCQRLQQPKSFLLPFQVYKLLYASRLADHGLPGQALQYCEQIATVLLHQDPASHPVLAQQVMKLSERLKLSDPLLLEMPEQDQTLEPDWLLQLRACCREWEVEDDPSQEAAPAQLELSWAATSIADEEPGQELPQTEDYQYDQWYEPMPLQGPRSHQDVSLRPPALTQVTASPLLGAEQERQPPTPGPGTATPPGGVFVEPRPQVVPPAGEVTEPWGVPASSEGVQPPLPVEQEELKARARTLSESSTISLDSRPSSESAAEDTAEELAAEEKPDEDKSSGFRWFGWFWSKPTKETSPKATSETASDSSTSGQQVVVHEDSHLFMAIDALYGDSDNRSPFSLEEWMPPAPPDAPLTAATSPLAPLPPRNLGAMEGENTFAVNPVPTETSFHRPPPPVGTIPLFNPVQISQLAATARPTQPKRLSQRRYPNAL